MRVLIPFQSIAVYMFSLVYDLYMKKERSIGSMLLNLIGFGLYLHGMVMCCVAESFSQVTTKTTFPWIKCPWKVIVWCVSSILPGNMSIYVLYNPNPHDGLIIGFEHFIELVEVISELVISLWENVYVFWWVRFICLTLIEKMSMKWCHAYWNELWVNTYVTFSLNNKHIFTTFCLCVKI